MKYNHKRKNKILFIICLIVVEISFLFLTYQSFTNKDIEETKKYLEFNKSTFAMYKENDQGKYVEIIDSNEFPSGGYTLNMSKSSCRDNNGNNISGVLSYEEDTVILASKKTVFCYLYFDQVKPDLTVIVDDESYPGVLPNNPNYVKSFVCDNGSSPIWNQKYNRLEFSDVIGKEEVCRITYNKRNVDLNSKLSNVIKTSPEIVAEGYNTYAGYRYEGRNPNNWIWFNNEMWRIIGFMEICSTNYYSSNYDKYICSEKKSLVKIIRWDSLGSFVYDNNMGANIPDTFGDTSLAKILNEYYLGKKIYTGSGSTDYPEADFSLSGINPYDYYGSMIESVYWYAGYPGDVDSVFNVYDKEKDQITKNKFKIGLMYMSDYGFGVENGDQNVHSKSIDSYGSYTQNNWIYKPRTWIIQKDQNTLNGVQISFRARLINHNGEVTSFASTKRFNIHPVLYLNENVYVVSGQGTEINPYVIGLGE